MVKIRIGSLFLLIHCLSLPSYSEKALSTERVLLVGDSWANVMWVAKTMRTVFDELGYGDVLEVGDVTALGGTRADQWKQPEKLALITSELKGHPNLEVAHISLGGNDFFSNWRTSLTPTQENQVFDTIAAALNILIQHCLTQKQTLAVLLCGYTYLNFEETRLAGIVPWCASTGDLAIWPRLGNPTPPQINTGLIRLEEHKAALTQGDPHVFHVNNLGLMQSWYGYPSKGIAPQSLPLPMGDPNLPSPPEALNNGLDCAHLSPEGYQVLTRNCVKEFYQKQFSPQGKKVSLGPGTFKGIADKNQDLLAESYIGDHTGGELLEAVLEWDPSTVPIEQNIRAARIFLTRKAVHGENPFKDSLPLGQPVCRLENPENPLLVLPTDIGIFAGTLAEDQWKVRIDLKKESLTTLARGIVRFHLSFTTPLANNIADGVTFWGSEAPRPEDRPTLELFLEEPVDPPSGVGKLMMQVQ